MGEIRAESVRNIALVSNVGAGKTSLTEALLFASGAIPTLGSVLQGSTVSDFEPEDAVSSSARHWRLISRVFSRLRRTSCTVP